MIVKFATLCDACNKRSEEYTSWPTCRECYGNFCPNHFTEPTDNEGRLSCICGACKALDEEADKHNSQVMNREKE